MAFDVQSAKKAGYSDDEILNHLTESRKFDVQGALNSGYTKQEIINHLAGSAPMPQPAKKPEMKSGLSGVAQVIGESGALNSKDYQAYQKSSQGLADMNLKLIQAIRKNKALGKDTSKLEQQLRANGDNTTTFNDIAPSAKKSNEQLVGDLAQTASYLAIPLGASSVAGRIGMGTAIGALSGGGNAMSENKSPEMVLSDTIKGASIGAVISGAFEALGYGLRKMASSRAVLNKTANTYNKELQPKASEITQQIEKTPAGEAFKTIGSKIRDEVGSNGKPLYVGTYQTMNDTAKNTIKTKGDELLNLLKPYDSTVKINRNEVAGDIITQLQDAMGTLKKSEIKVVENEVKRIAEKEINPTQALAYKRLYDSKIPDSFWTDTGDRTKAIAVQARYILRDNLRKLINEKTGNEAIKALNQSMGLAMDVRHLTSAQIALRSLEKIGAGGQGSISLFRAVYGTLIDDMLLNPAITTRISQGLKNMGKQGTGNIQTIKNIGKNLLINKSAK